MKKLFSTLVLIAFAFIMQMPFVHALDMMASQSSTSKTTTMSTAHTVSGDFCNTDTTHITSSCFREIPELKWIQSVKKGEFLTFIVVSIFISLFLLIFPLFRSFPILFKRRILYGDTLYLQLYGIVRNVN